MGSLSNRFQLVKMLSKTVNRMSNQKDNYLNNSRIIIVHFLLKFRASFSRQLHNNRFSYWTIFEERKIPSMERYAPINPTRQTNFL